MTFPLVMTGLSGEAQPAPLPWWFWVVLFLILTVILLWMWYQGRRAVQEKIEGTTGTVRSVPVEPDDLKLIEGIGPKISAVLQAGGIHTFADLADASGEALRKILLDAGMRLADPGTWRQQAELARDGKHAELKALQARLTAGRR